MKLPDLGIRSLFSGESPDTAASLGATLLSGLLLLILCLFLPEMLKDTPRHQFPESSSKIPVTGRLLILAGPVAAQISPEQPASEPSSLPFEGSSDPAAAPEALSSQSDSDPASSHVSTSSSSQAHSSSPAPQKSLSQESAPESPAPKPRPATPARPRKASGPSAVTPRRERQGEEAPRSEISDKKKNGSGSPEKSVTSASGSPVPAAPAAPSREPLRQDAGRAAREGHLKGAGLIRREIERLKRYPPRALRNGIEGSGVILAEVGASGRVSGARVSKKTGNRFLDGSLEEIAAGIVGFDTGIPGEPYRTEIPVLYLISPR